MIKHSTRNFTLICFGLPLVVALVLSTIWSMHWPLLGDASLMHYVIFLMGKGMKPYRDIIDINLPGTYLAEFLAMKMLGANALAWRLYDLAILLLIWLTMMIVAPQSHRWVSSGIAAGIFALIHMQDGIAQLGQRDLLIALLLLAGYAALLTAQRHARQRGILVFNAFLFIGISLTIKPTFLLLGVILMCLSAKHMRSLGLSYPMHFACCLLGISLPSLIAILWLYREHSLIAFAHTSVGLILFHSELGRKSLLFLFTHALSPIAPVCVCWVFILALIRPRLTLERVEIMAGVFMAFLAYVSQGKGYPYHRYPLLGLLLVAMETDFIEALYLLTSTRAIAAFALVFQCCYLAPRSAMLIHSFSAATPFQNGLSSELKKLQTGLPGQVQCLDTFGGCINTLYDLRIAQSSGYLYDCYLFTRDQNEVSTRYRYAFWQTYKASRPSVIVLTDQFCFGEKGGFSKLENWPLLRDDLAINYVQEVDWTTRERQHWWSRWEDTPRFRIYIRK